MEKLQDQGRKVHAVESAGARVFAEYGVELIHDAFTQSITLLACRVPCAWAAG